MSKELFVIWFKYTGGRKLLSGRRELRKEARQFHFDADEVIKKGETKMFHSLDRDVVGGVYRVEKFIDDYWQITS